MQVSDLLDRLFTKFDNLCAAHGLFKVETIGDCFIAAAGIPTYQSHHTLRVAKFALLAAAAARETLLDTDNESCGSVKIRIGVHVGPVVGVLIGATRPKYTLLGDTMNIGARALCSRTAMHLQFLASRSPLRTFRFRRSCSRRCAIVLSPQWAPCGRRDASKRVRLSADWDAETGHCCLSAQRAAWKAPVPRDRST